MVALIRVAGWAATVAARRCSSLMYAGCPEEAAGAMAATGWVIAATGWVAGAGVAARAWAANTWVPAAAPAISSTALSVVNRKPDPLKAQEDNADPGRLPAPAVPPDVSQPLLGWNP